MDTDHQSDGESVEKDFSGEKPLQHGTWESDFSDVSSFDGYSTDSSWKPYRDGKAPNKRELRIKDSMKAYGKTGDSDWIPYSYHPKTTIKKTKKELDLEEDLGSRPLKKRGRPKKEESDHVQRTKGPKETASEASGSRPSSPAAEEDMSGDDTNQKVIGSGPPKKRGRPKKAAVDRVQIGA